MVPLRVAILSDDRLFCEGVLRLLPVDVSLEVTTYENGPLPPALRMIQDIVLLDARMTGSLTTCAVLSMPRGPSVVFVSAPDDDRWAENALSVGARGILTKTAHGTELAKAIRVVSEGGIWARRRWLAASLEHLSTAVRPNSASASVQLASRLSQREREVFHYAAMGAGNKELADRLGISESTVKVHLTHIFQKFGVNGRAELAAAYHGLLPAADFPSRPVATKHLA
jgi:DNA-binding NarL/FixJ family response regulator